jgi:undecaprenyl diphosphate synthase
MSGPSHKSDELKGPAHVAIIMDGNGRWAQGRGLPRTAGHKAGIDALRRAVTAADEFGIRYLTIYSFSTENWSRPAMEVRFLLELLKRFIRQDVADLHTKNIRIRIIGSREELDSNIRSMLSDAETLTAQNTGLTLVVAFNYGSKQEILRAAQRLATQVAEGKMSVSDITLTTIQQNLDTHDIPDPDLLIRTGGEVRVSNFLLWQLAYAELVFLPDYWPDFDREIFAKALTEFHGRERRFGGLKVQSA